MSEPTQDPPHTSASDPIPSCLICQKPLGELETRLNRLWHFACQHCQYCKGEIPNDTLILKSLEENEGTLCHEGCRKTQLFQDFKAQKLPLTLSHVKLLNDQILSFYPAVSPDTTDVSALYDTLLALQECAVNVSWAMKLTKDKLAIRDSQRYANEVQTKTKEARAKQTAAEAEKLEKQAKSDMLKAERENPTLRLRRKAIEGFMKMGLSEEMATQMVDAQATKGKA